MRPETPRPSVRFYQRYRWALQEMALTSCDHLPHEVPDLSPEHVPMDTEQEAWRHRSGFSFTSCSAAGFRDAQDLLSLPDLFSVFCGPNRGCT